MATSTTRLQATKPASSENVSVTVLNNNFDLFDGAVGSSVGTSASRPASAFQGRMFYTTDSAKLYVNTAASASTAAAWTEGNGSLTASATWDPGSLANLVAVTQTITVTGAVVGDTVLATHSSVSTAAAAWVLTGYVSAANTARVVLLNATGGTVDLASGTLRVRVFRQP